MLRVHCDRASRFLANPDPARPGRGDCVRHRPWLYTTLGLAVAALASCGEETTAPSTEPSPNAPTLAVAHDTWISRRNMPYGRWDFGSANVPNALGRRWFT